MDKIEILIIDDNKQLYEQFCSNICEPFNLTYCDSKGCMRNEISGGKYKMIIMNFDLASGDAFELYENLKDIYFGPIVFLTKVDDVKTRILGLEKGADAFILLPCDFDELKLRIYKILQHLEQSSNETIGDYFIDNWHHKIYHKGRQLKFSPIPHRLLIYFLHNPNRNISREELLENVWDYDAEFGKRLVDTNINYIRSVTLDGKIKSVRGIGYCYDLDEE